LDKGGLTKLPGNILADFLGFGKRIFALAELNYLEKEVVSLYNRGFPVGRIGERIGYSDSGVRHVLRRAEDAGVEVERRPVGRPQIDRGVLLELVNLALYRGFRRTTSVRYAAARTGCSERTVWRALRGD